MTQWFSAQVQIGTQTYSFLILVVLDRVVLLSDGSKLVLTSLGVRIAPSDAWLDAQVKLQNAGVTVTTVP